MLVLLFSSLKCSDFNTFRPAFVVILSGWWCTLPQHAYSDKLQLGSMPGFCEATETTDSSSDVVQVVGT